MTALAYEYRRLTAVRIFDLVDAYARERGLEGFYPRPIGRLRLRLVDLPERPELVVVRNPGGYHLFFGEVRFPGDRRRRLAVDGTVYRLRVAGDFYQSLETELEMSPSTEPMALDFAPGYAYPFPGGSTLLRGSVHHFDGRGVGGATVSAEFPEADGTAGYRTGDSGQFVLVFPDRAEGRVTVKIESPGVAELEVPGDVEPGRETSLRQTALRGRVTAGGAPAREARIWVTGNPDEKTTTDDDGAWFYYFGLDQGDETVTVNARLNGNTKKKQTAVVPGTTIVVSTFRF